MSLGQLIDCPVCGSSDTRNLLELNCGNIDGSRLYSHAVINTCNGCGHVYNKLSSHEIEGLAVYYNEEYAPVNIGSTDYVGDRPGSGNQLTRIRYSQLWDVIKPLINAESRVLDVGCAMGGFLDFLSDRSLTNLCGIDFTQKYVERAAASGKYEIKYGNAEKIPFPNAHFDLVVIDQVLEHLVDPVIAFREAKRVVKDGGFLCIAVPDAGRYAEIRFFDFYWFLLREHIQHFDIDHLAMMAAWAGFDLTDVFNKETPMMSESMILPNLIAVFRSTADALERSVGGHFALQRVVTESISNDGDILLGRIEKILELRQSGKKIYVWGIGREFLYLYEQAGLKSCNIAAMIDMNRYKQEHVTIGGRSILSPSVLDRMDDESVIIITAVAHKEAISRALVERGLGGRIIEI